MVLQISNYSLSNHWSLKTFHDKWKNEAHQTDLQLLFIAGSIKAHATWAEEEN